jgi:hypothetical protein
MEFLSMPEYLKNTHYAEPAGGLWVLVYAEPSEDDSASHFIGLC